MNKIQLYALILNLIIYIIMIFPIIIISRRKSIYKNKKKFITYLIFTIILEIILSLIIYTFPKKIFSIFTAKTGIINYAVYASKILFISSSLYGIKILIPTFIYYNNLKIKSKKTAIFLLSKIAVTLILIFIGYNLFNTKGMLYAFPLSDLIYYIIYIIFFLNIIR